MFLRIVSVINIVICIAAMLLNPNQIGTLFVSICASVAMIYFADLCSDVSKIRSEIEKLRRRMTAEAAAASQCEPEQPLQNRSADAPYDGVNRPGPLYEAVLKAEKNKR